MADHVSRRSFLRSMVAVAASGAGGALLASCGGTAATPAADSGTAATSGDAAANAGGTEVRFHARIGAQEDALYDMTIPKFMQAHSDIKIVKESFPGAEYAAKISTLKAGNTLGDAMWSALGGALIQYHYGQNIIRPIDDLVKSQNLDLSGYYKGCLDAITVEGKLLGLPFKSHPGIAAVYYNQTALDAAGIATPTKDWTMDQQLQMAKALTKTEGDRVTQFGYKPDTSWKGFVTLIRAFGGELISEDRKTFQLNADAGRQAAQWLYDLHHVHKVAPQAQPDNWHRR